MDVLFLGLLGLECPTGRSYGVPPCLPVCFLACTGFMFSIDALVLLMCAGKVACILHWLLHGPSVLGELLPVVCFWRALAFM